MKYPLQHPFKPFLHNSHLGATNCSFTKVFDHVRYAVGAIVLGPNGVKEPQVVSRADMIFQCVKGEVRVQLHESEFIVRKGDTFSAPILNRYAMINDSPTVTAKLTFFQSKVPSE